MRDTIVSYIGTDSQFEERLARAVGACGLGDAFSSGTQADDLAECAAGLLVVDNETAGMAEVIRRARAAWGKSLVVLAVADETGSRGGFEGLAGRDGCDDILCSTTSRDLLEMKIRLYTGWLRGQGALIGAETGGGAIGEADGQADELRRLQERLVELESRLQVQDQVLGKIDRISQLAHRINSLELEEIAAACIEKIPQLVSARYASLYAYDEGNRVLHLLHHNHPHTVNRVVVLSEHSASLMAVAVRLRRMLIIGDLSKWPDEAGITVSRAFSSNYKSKSCIVAPLISGGVVCGVLNLADKAQGDAFNEAGDRLGVELFCDMVASAISNARLYEKVQKQARTDSLTGLVNHSTFYSELDREIHRCRRYGSSLSLVMIDLDELKKINDAYGHLAGDAALRFVANQITHCIRETDVAARYGGDEFALVFPNTDILEATVVADRLVKMVCAQQVETNDFQFCTSVSVGLSQYRPGVSLEEFMNEADSALFEAKAAGRNRMKTFELAAK